MRTYHRRLMSTSGYLVERAKTASAVTSVTLPHGHLTRAQGVRAVVSDRVAPRSSGSRRRRIARMVQRRRSRNARGAVRCQGVDNPLGRETHRHRRARAQLARERDGAAMQLAHCLYQRKPKPRTRIAAAQRRIHLTERLYHLGQVFRADPDPGVADAEPKGAVLIHRGRQRDLAAGRRELHRIR